MRKHLLRISVTIVSAVVALVLFGSLRVLLTSVADAPAVMTTSGTQAKAGAVVARRAISIPFGISSVLTLTEDGSQILATGHGVCWEEGQMFDLRVRIAQSSTHAFAEGRSVDVCAGGERQMWDAAATVDGSAAFEAGNVRACAEATEFAQHGIADEYRWCKDVEVAGSE